MVEPKRVNFGRLEKPEAESRIAANVAGFARFMRDNGFLVGMRETSDALRGLTGINILNQNDMRRVLRCALASNKRDWKRFDELYDAYWLGHAKRRGKATSGGSNSARTSNAPDRPSPPRTSPLADHLERMKGSGNAEDEDTGTLADEGRRGGASAAENLAEADIGQISDPSQLEQLNDLAARLAARIRYRRSRRRRLSRTGSQLDIRRILHRSVSTGGTPIHLYHRRSRKKPLKLVMFLDVSGSMDQYSRFFMRFMHALIDNYSEADAFIFHTRLVQITSTLCERNPLKLMERMALIAQGWSGGTKIGKSLAVFNRDYARSVMTSRTMVIIVSDGFDTGVPEELGKEMATLRRRAKRIVWLNPLLGFQGYEPSSAGMAAARPHLDLFAPAHNLSSLAALETELVRV